MNVLIAIPTLTGREAYLENCIRGYNERTDVDLHFSIVKDAPTCGIGWQRCVEQGLKQDLDIDFVHLSNDDIVPAVGWLEPLVEAVSFGYIGAPRLEPAGFHLGNIEMPQPPPMPPKFAVSDHGYWYSDLAENQPKIDCQIIDHTALPFCSVEQLEKIGPFIPSHFGTDKFFCYRAKQEGFEIMSRQFSVIFNYAANIGRSKDDWTEVDLLDFDCVIGYPAYIAGELDINEQHSLRLTPEGLAMVRTWRKESFG